MNKFKILSQHEILKIVLPLLVPVLIIAGQSVISDSLKKTLSKKFLNYDISPGAMLPEDTRVFFQVLLKSELKKLPYFDMTPYKDAYFLRYASTQKIKKSQALVVGDLNKNTTAKVEEDIGNPPSFELSSTFVGKKVKYAVINGDMYKEKDIIFEEKIIRIEQNRIQLSGPWGIRWLYVKF